MPRLELGCVLEPEAVGTETGACPVSLHPRGIGLKDWALPASFPDKILQTSGSVIIKDHVDPRLLQQWKSAVILASLTCTL